MRSRTQWASIDRSPAVTDAAIAAVLAALAILWLWVDWLPARWPSALAIVGIGLLQCLPLAWRRRSPLAVLALVTLGTIAYGLAGGADTLWTANPWLLAAYSAGAYGDHRWRDRVRSTATAVYVGYVAYEVFIGIQVGDGVEPAGRLRLFQLFTLIGNLTFVAGVWWFGDATRIRHLREAQLAERTDQLVRERETNARRAVLDERVRISRELHDVVAHHVSLMGVQAGAARRVLSRRPDQVAELLTTIEATSRGAVRELHQLLGFLRRDKEDELTPPPGLRQLDSLVAQMRAAGLPTTLMVDGEIRSLPPGVDLSAFRIIQEALTNTLKHAGPASAAVAVRYGERMLEIEITDDGGAAASPGSGLGGNGLVGMRERIALLGGRLEVGPRPSVGFAVRAHLPLDRAAR